MSWVGESHHDLQLLLGGYVLGGLDGADRRRLEEHLRQCAECTAELARFAAVPGLLTLASGSEDGVEPGRPAATPQPQPSPPPVRLPDDSLPRLLAAARARRGLVRRRMLLAAAAVVLVLAGVTGAAWLGTRPEPLPPGTPLVAATSLPGSYAPGSTSGKVVLESKSWGTQLRLTMYYAPGTTDSLSAWVVDNDGTEQLAANWTTPPGGRCYVIGATSVKRDRVATIEVRNSDDVVLLSTG